MIYQVSSQQVFRFSAHNAPGCGKYTQIKLLPPVNHAPILPKSYIKQKSVDHFFCDRSAVRKEFACAKAKVLNPESIVDADSVVKLSLCV